MKRIHIHWTAAQSTPNSEDLKHYHYLYTCGAVITGNHKPEDNINCNDGNYAAHTGGLNTNAIGVAFCGMMGFDYKTKKTPYPLDLKTCERGFKHIAELAKKYNIPIDIEHIMTHYEIGQAVKENKIKRTPLTAANIGKIDIIYLHPYNNITPDKMGNFIRQKIQWYYNRL